MCVYIHSNRSQTSTGIFDGLRVLVNESFIFNGDMNPNHPTWDSRRICRRSRQKAKEINSGGLVVANTVAPTYLRRHFTTSVINVSIHTMDLQVRWNIAPGIAGSDHFQFHVQIGEIMPAPCVGNACCTLGRFRSELLLTTQNPATPVTASLEKSTRKSARPLHAYREGTRAIFVHRLPFLLEPGSLECN